MEIPITFRFLERLNSFQEIARIDGEKRPQWVIEKSILSWAANPLHHQHLNVEINVEMALDHVEITGLDSGDERNNAETIRQCYGNLVMRGYATWREQNVSIVFTKEGFLTGETVNELARGIFRRFRYRIVYWACWIIFFSGFVVAISEALKELTPVYSFFRSEFWQIIGAIHF